MEVETKVAESKPTDLGTLLSKVKSKAAEVTTEPVTATEKPTEPKVEPAPEVKAEAKPVTVTPDEAKTKGLLATTIAERERRQRAESEAAQLRAELERLRNSETVTAEPAEVTEVAQAKKVLERVAAVSEQQARIAHSDFDEKYAAFAEAAVENPAIYHTVMAADLPGEAAYQAGKTILLSKKYGWETLSDPEKLRSALLKEVRAEWEAKQKADELANTKAVAADKAKTPTDISQARSASPPADLDYKTPQLSHLLAKVKKRRG